jgi:hypothetical protein
MNAKLLFLVVGVVLLTTDAGAQAIFGSVKTIAGLPLEGVLVSATRDRPLQRISTTTDSSGGYVLGAGLGGTYTVEAIEAGHTFTPASTNVTISGSSVRVDFTTLATAPTVVTLGSIDVAATRARLHGSIRSNGAVMTTAWFEYSLTTNYGSVSEVGFAGASPSLHPYTNLVVSLLNGATYHFRAAASNSFGVRYGEDMSFATSSGIPSIAALPPTDAAATTMRLNASMNPNGADAVAWFEVGTTTNYGNTAVLQSLGDGTYATNFTQVLIGLTPGTTYYHRAVAASSFGTNYGAEMMFTPVFNYTGITVTPSGYNGIAWGDYDNDGRLDILVTGWQFPNFNTAFARVFRNHGDGTFSDIGAGLPGLARSAAA